MKVSIITVCYNSAKTIETTIRSVLSQSFRDIEYIVVDGGSTDGTLDILSSYSNQISNWISEPDKGIYDAMNKGIKLSNGDIIATLNADDVYTDETIVAEMMKLIQNKESDAAYGDLAYIAPKDNDRIVRLWKPGQYKKGAFSCGWVAPHPTFFCRKHIFEKHGYYNDDFKIAADFELMLRFIEKHQVKVAYLPKVIVKMRTGGRANVWQGIIKGNFEIIKSFKMNNLKLSPFFFIRKPLMKISQLFKRTSE